ncbi:MAG TPA: GAF domain-containing sensor histidine kinase [Longimicrobiaceae bacterium]|nr:GAF domain-containing sensor histidine kinase [Longimicrobiaceae bacterium]
MDLLDVAVHVYESDTPATAFQALVEGLAAAVPLRSAAWVERECGGVREHWPDGHAPLADLVEAGLEAAAPCLLATPDADALYLPLGAEGVLVLRAAPGALDGQAGWERLCAALRRISERDRRLRQAEDERDTLRLRAEESEALHVLGLAANRTLDPDEVLNLVARFTRTLLGAHYVTVNTTGEDGHIRTVASVGLRSPDPDDDPFAGRVVDAGKPLSAGGEGDPFEVDEFPFHAAEEMRVGLGVPLSLFGETFGALVVGYRRDYPLAPRDTRLALTLAGHAAVAISNARLHRALADRSRELERAYEELRWSSQAKERFFASMSHELRTPLNAILGYQSLLLDGVGGPVAEAQLSFLERAHRATENLLHLVNDVLDLSKLEAGKMELMVRPVSLGEVVEDAYASVAPLADRKGLRVQVPPLGALPPWRTDADRVRQILVNLFSNAVKFTDAGEVTVAVSAPGPEPDGGPPGDGRAPRWLEIRVTDTGPGIAPENRERIFHEFEQVVSPAGAAGTGLGLPISRKLARLLGGDLLVESTLGRGSTFVLRLPDPAPTVGARQG